MNETIRDAKLWSDDGKSCLNLIETSLKNKIKSGKQEEISNAALELALIFDKRFD